MQTWGLSFIWNVLAGIAAAAIVGAASWLWWTIRHSKQPDVLIKRLSMDANPREREQAKKRLLRMCKKDSPKRDAAIQSLISAASQREDSFLSENSADVLAQIGPPAIGRMIVHRATANQPDLNTNQIDGALCKMKSKEEVQALVQLLAEPDWRIQRDAADFLGRVGQQEAIIPLVDLALNSAVPVQVRAQCASSLTAFRGPNIAGYLVQLLNSGCPSQVRTAAAESLGEVGEESAIGPLLTACQTDNDPEVLKKAALSLGNLKARQALPVLKGTLFGLNTDWQVKVACIEAIEKIDGSEGKKILAEGDAYFYPVDKELHRLCLNACHNLPQGD